MLLQAQIERKGRVKKYEKGMKCKRSLPATGRHGKRGKMAVAKGMRGSIVLNIAHNIGHVSYERGEASLVSKILKSKMRRGGNRKSKSKAEAGNRQEGRVQASKVRIANQTQWPSLESN